MMHISQRPELHHAEVCVICPMSCIMLMEGAQMWVSRVRGHALVRGLTTRVPPPLVARVTRHERALSQAAAEQGGIVPIIEGFLQ